MLERDPDSHKGQNGKVMVIGGNEIFHGAPILCALGAEVSGVDLTFLFLPPCHAAVARGYSLNFIVRPFQEDFFTLADVKALLEFSEEVDTVVIGPGLGIHEKTEKAIKEFLEKVKKPVVVDASALLYLPEYPANTVLTPHRGEFKNLTGEEPTPENVQKWARDLKVTIVCKAPKDIIADKENLAFNETGNALMTVGGTGDALAGLIGGFVAQKMVPFEAAKLATRLWGQAGENLAKIHGSLRAIDLIHAVPGLLLKNE